MGWRARSSVPAAAALTLADAAAFAVAYPLLAVVATDAGVGAFALVTAVGVMAALMLARLYPGYRTHPHEILRRRTIAFLLVGGMVGAWVGVARGVWPEVGLLGGYLLLAGLVQIVVAPFVQRVLHRLDLWGETAQIIAEPETRARLDRYFRDNWRLGVVPASGDGLSRAAHTALVARPLPEPEALEQLRQGFATVMLLADMPDAAATGLRAGDVRGEIGLRLAGGESSAAGGLRRVADLAVAMPALVCAAPIIAVSAAVIWLVDPGPVLFRQAREGLHGRTVRIFKLRTMYRDAEARLEALLESDPAARAEWEAHFKLRKDPRVLPVVGSFLRSASCDELPQLLNIITGDMGLVGPRPFPPYHLAAMPAEFRKKRASVVPGLTGLWQVSARSEADVARAQQLDEFYIDNRSLWLDLSILLKTFGAVVRRTGAY